MKNTVTGISRLQLTFFGLAAAVSGCLAGGMHSRDCVLVSAEEKDLGAVETLGNELYTIFLKGENLCRKRLKGQKLNGFYKLER
ncbi:MAG TPA: hypothetical protein O0X97_04505 [Methanocorpusculum sp.]|nr:hypothetical protein [Methanocorpusculum sp.]